MLEWLHNTGCPWDTMTCWMAAQGGHLEVLQWVRENDAAGEVLSERLVRTCAEGHRKQEVRTWLDGLSAP